MEQDNQNPTNQPSNNDLNQTTIKNSVEQSPLPTPNLKNEEVTTQTASISFFQKYKRRLVSVSLVLVLVVVGLIVYSVLVKQKRATSTSTTGLTSVPTQGQVVVRKEVSAEIDYIPREKILQTIKYERNTDVEATSGDDWELDIYDFYKVGTITSGKYKDGDLLLVFFNAGGPCKGASCDKPVRLRYVKKDNTVTFLPKISYPNIKLFRTPVLDNETDVSKINPFNKFGFSLTEDENFTIPILEYPKEIQGVNQRQILKAPEYLMEEDGELDQSKLYKVFTLPIYGDIYTTKVEFSPSRSFEPEGQGGGFGAGSGTGGCKDMSCFVTNQFFAFRPDGTFLKFSYNPDVSVKAITWTDNKNTGDMYISKTVAGCNLQELDDISVVAPSLVKDTDLVQVGKANNTGDIIYGLKDQNHKLYTEFYNTYEEYYAGPYIYPEEERRVKSFDDFIDSQPIFFWRDPFGRLIRFNNNEFLPPFACEPIIYLYPEAEREIEVKLGTPVNITDSTPKYKNGWNVLANPFGEITNLSDGRTYPYLFWEGWSYIFPIKKEGFLVKREEVPEFFSNILPRLGLDNKETSDFLEVWLPYFSDSPYYFITFIDQEIIDKIAPLEINPKPNIVIRILMDYKPLEEPVKIPELKLPETPQREGFTVVEWGGLKRWF